MADKRIDEYPTLEQAGNGDLILVSASGQTYNITFATLKRDSKGDKGDTGDDGIGISSVAKTGTSGLVDTYTITFTNGATTTFTVTNGENGTIQNLRAEAVTLPAGSQATAEYSSNNTLVLGIPTGPAGTNGVGVPTGGTAGQVLAKNTSTNYDTHWITPTKAYKYTCTIPNSGWTAYQGSIYTVTVAVSGILASDTDGIVTLQQTGTETTDNVLRTAAGKLTRITAANNALVVYSKGIPGVALPISVQVFR